MPAGHSEVGRGGELAKGGNTPRFSKATFLPKQATLIGKLIDDAGRYDANYDAACHLDHGIMGIKPILDRPMFDRRRLELLNLI
ncbi:hypothetical protein PQ455_04860 [Sphingomonas naphthae]|uniref:Uncharacterized protein n=1 Tax=Sphingomonas naphthae TaxID=1813468 RepID=A0ABY7TNE6_9SPHN|nr:hypothetical protein [Sphingomonas naphthae]WCT74563.1 hypothetical protein PQ455_04860 [Sphingomonas naphthae]